VEGPPSGFEEFEKGGGDELNNQSRRDQIRWFLEPISRINSF
jgi:hypothetical protein